ncbi:MAG: DNA polymerase I [Longibaculum muris]|uniref:DNA polymerase I n=1 Tax=Longibaculum muris TaxID=1796628 RepID=A0A4R3Z7C7_9FIRM|nr:DNA polymerase I [Longibaculum muris]KXU45279.1 DNA-directed DNA polymerase [Candidatus Stoquefichus sp. KLE1796]MBS5369822.1 DNA polymerase I [Coprobacillus cateniformis]MCR1886513.1 DNA polymerase I [Longibaculum muris]MED9811438.1 DNA polymerase I [Longibaculum muris]TCW01565.1 DNA polymerase I [Longibaculum muris]
MEELVLIDGNSLLFKAYYATAAMGNLMVNKDGIPTNAVFGFANMLQRILQREAAYLVVAFDYGKKTFRNDLLDEYKATRKETPDELKCQFAMIREFLDAYQIPYFEMEGFEGDDLIGTLSALAEKEGLSVSIFTGDKDAFQLVSDQTTVYRTVKGVTQLDIYTPATLQEKYGLEPDQIRDFLGLMGDSADNIPGIKGVGEKTALKLLHEYGTIENLKEHAHEIKGKMGEKIRENIDLGLQSKKIATILRDIPMELDLDDARYTGYDFEKLKAFYQKYDMNSLLKKISVESRQPQTSELKFEIVEHMPAITQDSSVIGAIYDQNYHKSIVLGYALYNASQAYFITFENALKDEEFLKYLSNENYHKYSYNIKAQILSAKWNGIEIKGMDFDLQLASYILNPSLKDEMKYICDYYGYTSLQYEEEVFGKNTKKHIPELSLLAKHTVSKAKAIYELKDEAIRKLKEEEQYDLYQTLELPVAYILAEMEYTGAKVDIQVLKDLEKTFEHQIKEIEEDIYMLADEKFNISSPKQLGEILFNKLGLPNGKKTKSGYSTSQDILEKIEDLHPIVPLIQQYRMLTKLTSTYVKGLQEQVFPDGKIHTIFNQALTQTGRLSSIDPNLQNIPVRQEEGKLIRKAFVASHDYLVTFDYSQIELRILAHLAQVKSLIEAFNQDKDIHTHTAALVFKVKDEEVTSNMRRQAKAVNFGIIYGMGEFRLSKQIGVSLAEAKEFIRRYFEEYPEIRSYMDNIVEDCKKDGYVSTVLNRKRYIPTINDKNFIVREQAKRFAMNSPIQGSGADILKLAMVKVDQLMKEKQLKSKMILQVHDELIFDVYKEELDEMMTIIKSAMEEAFLMDVPLKVDGAYATNWYDLK